MSRNSVYLIFPLVVFRGIGVFLQVLMQFAVAQVAGASGLGLMQLYQTWTCVLGETNALGLPTQTMKYASVSPASKETLHRLIRSLKAVFKFWLVAVLIFAFGSLLDPEWTGFSLGVQLAFLWSILCFSILRISAEALKAAGASTAGIFAENLLMPFLMSLFCFVLLGLYSGQKGPDRVSSDLLIIAASLFFTLAAAYSLGKSLYRISSKTKVGESLAVKQSKIFSTETRFFWGTAVLNIGFLNLPFLLMPYFGSLEEIGFFALAFKLINPISTILIMLSAYFGPQFARAAAGKVLSIQTAMDMDRAELKKLLFQSQLVSLALYLPVLLPILLLSDWILPIFGPEFLAAKPFLFILAAAHLVNAVTGLSGNLLNMMGQGKREFQGAILFFALATISGLLVGPSEGLFGIAVVYSLAFAAKNIWSYGFALQALGKKTTPAHLENSGSTAAIAARS